jgi:hypothetical protein
MKRDTLIQHKEAVVVCEENEPINLSYNALLTTPHANMVFKLVVPVVIAKSSLTCTNCGKIGHTFNICHYRKREVLVVPTTTVKSTKPIVETKTQPTKLISSYLLISLYNLFSCRA